MRPRQRRWNLNIHYHPVILDAIPVGATRALDVGSGNGLLSFDLAARGLEVVGIDPDEASVERARSDPGRSERTTFVHGDVFTYPFEPGSFDLVVASAMLHHVDAVKGLRRMTQLARPGGVIAVVGFANPSGPIDWALAAAGFCVCEGTSRHGPLLGASSAHLLAATAHDRRDASAGRLGAPWLDVSTQDGGPILDRLDTADDTRHP
ncbi:MAG: class I SAM-dependent methyltransferase [Actinomycetota bacterium]